MDILCENNAFQNIDKCLKRECTYPPILGKNKHYQVEDLLQFCIQIIFHDTINIAGNVPVTVYDETKQLIDVLKKHGIKDVFDINLFGGEDSSDQVVAKADGILTGAVINVLMGSEEENRKGSIDDYLTDCSNQENDSVELLKNFFPNLTPENWDTVDQVTRAIQDNNTRLLNTYNAYATVRKDGGLLKIFSDEQVRQRIIDFANGNWNLLMTLRLMVKFRNLLNQTLAKQDKQMLAPSVIRGKAALQENRIFQKIENIFKNVNHLEDVTIGDINCDDDTPEFANIGSVTMPSLKQYLIRESEGQVASVLEKTAELRSRFSSLRNFIRNRTENTNYTRWWTGLNEIAQNVSANIPGLPECNQKPVSANVLVIPTPWGRIPVPITTLPTPWGSVPMPKFWEIPQAWRKDASVQAFTEIILDMDERDNNAAQQLIDNCRQQ